VPVLSGSYEFISSLDHSNLQPILSQEPWHEMLSVLLMSSKETKIIACLLLLLIQPPPHIKSEVPQLFSFPTKSKSAKEQVSEI
jgi:hypothetical protein